jgi:hypothetical protein
MQTFNTRNEMIAALVPKNETYAEIGVFKGDFAKTLLSTLTPRQLVLFDLFQGSMGSGDVDGNNFQTTNLTQEFARLQRELPADIVTFQKGDSSSLLTAHYPDNHFTMVYIDGDHGYEGCKKDLEAAFKKCKSGGWIMGHDYEMNMAKARTRYVFGVQRAVDEFCTKYGQVIVAKGMDGCVSYAIQVSK